MNKVRVGSLAGYVAYLSSSSSLQNIIKLSQTVWELWPAQDFGFKGDNYRTKIMRVVYLACDTPTGPLYIPTKYYQNMSKIIKVIECTRMRIWTDGWTDLQTFL